MLIFLAMQSVAFGDETLPRGQQNLRVKLHVQEVPYRRRRKGIQRAIMIQLEAFNRASNEFASRRMDKSIRQGPDRPQDFDEIRI